MKMGQNDNLWAEGLWIILSFLYFSETSKLPIISLYYFYNKKKPCTSH